MYICDFKHTWYQIYEADYCLKHFKLVIICIRLKKANIAVAVAHCLHSRLRPGKNQYCIQAAVHFFPGQNFPFYEKSASTIEKKQDDN